VRTDHEECLVGSDTSEGFAVRVCTVGQKNLARVEREPVQAFGAANIRQFDRIASIRPELHRQMNGRSVI
jgi:hypothetical protein